jgi:transposase
MQLSDTGRHKIVFEFERCKSISKVSRKLGYHRNTVRRWVNKAKAGKELTVAAGGGRKKALGEAGQNRLWKC